MIGNYVAVNCKTNAFDLLGLEESSLDYHPHITLMWSEHSDKDHTYLKDLVTNMSAFKMAKAHKLKPTKVELFENKNGGVSVVLVVNHGCLKYIHQMLALIGLNHSFEEYVSHMSLTYNTPRQAAEEIKRTAELMLDKITIQLTDVVAEDAKSTV